MVEIDSFLTGLALSKEEPVVVAVSGGPDSMALLVLLENYFKNVICAHVNHNTGRIGQKEDEELVRLYCKMHHHPFESMTIESYNTSNFHDQAHKIRYHFFEKVMQKYHSSYLFTAHHGDDLMETMLFRIIRGSTLKAATGFSKISKQKDYFIVRPLLAYTKQDLLKYDIKHQIPYRIDPSNEKEIYTRNRIRKYLLPFLKKENPNIHRKFLKFSEELGEIELYLSKQIEKEWKNRYQNDSLSLKGWDDLDIVLQKRLLEYLLGTLYHDNREQLKTSHIQLLMKMISNKRSGAKMDLPGDFYVIKEYQTLKFMRKEKDEPFEFLLTSDLTLPNGHEIRILKEEFQDSNFICRLSKEDVSFPLCVRSRKPQDKIHVKGMQESKKIKDIFINEKVPYHLRQNWPIVIDKTGKIVWIPGIKKSKFDKTKEEKYDIILKYY